MLKDEILKQLKESPDYHSGQELCTAYGVSRTAVWKAIRSLIGEGYEIEGVQNRGYRLLACPEVLTKEQLARRPYVPWPGAELVVYDETDSTNLRAEALGNDGAPNGTLVVAAQQTAGRGRRGRVWKSPKGSGLYYSILLYPDLLPQQASMLTLVMALSICRAINETEGVQAGIKWPNDVVIDGRKVCGILTEMHAEPDLIKQVVIGCGINVNNPSFPDEIAETATSLLLQTGKRQDAAQLLERIMKGFYDDFRKVEEAGDLTPVLDDYNELLLNREARVRVLDPRGEYTGIAHGVNAHGELIVDGDDGKTTAVYAGEVSVRGIYGYV